MINLSDSTKATLKHALISALITVALALLQATIGFLQGHQVNLAGEAVQNTASVINAIAK